MRALLIWNPVSGRNWRRRKALLDAAVARLRQGGWTAVDLVETQAVGGAVPVLRRELQRTAYDLVLAAGGDGTIGQVAGELLRWNREHAPAVALGILPLGSANVLAQSLGISLRLPTAVERLLKGEVGSLPVGAARFTNGRQAHFVAMASAGFDAHIVHRVTPSEKRRWGMAAYGLRALRDLFRYEPIRLELHSSTGPLEADLVIFALSHLYGGPFRVRSRDDGGPTLLALRGRGWRLLVQAACLVLQRLAQAPGTESRRCADVEIATAGAPVELDGDASGFSPVRLSWEGETVPLLLPAQQGGRNGREARRANGSQGTPLRRCDPPRREDEAAAADLPLQPASRPAEFRRHFFSVAGGVKPN